MITIKEMTAAEEAFESFNNLGFKADIAFFTEFNPDGLLLYYTREKNFNFKDTRNLIHRVEVDSTKIVVSIFPKVSDAMKKKNGVMDLNNINYGMFAYPWPEDVESLIKVLPDNLLNEATEYFQSGIFYVLEYLYINHKVKVKSFITTDIENKKTILKRFELGEDTYQEIDKQRSEPTYPSGY